MRNFIDHISIRFRLFIPLLAGIVLAMALATVSLTRISLKTMDTEMEQSLSMQVHTIVKMFEREHELKMDQVRTNLKVLHELFYQKKFSPSGKEINWNIMNQLSFRSHKTTIQQWTHDGKVLHRSTEFVDQAQSLFGGTVSIFQLADSGFVRISTNVLRADSSRALGTYIPLKSPVSLSVLRGETYYGRAYVVNDWYITAYEPIRHQDRVIGMIYVGNKEKDLEVLRKNISELPIGKSGFTFVFDDEGEMIMHPGGLEEYTSDDPVVQSILNRSFNPGGSTAGMEGVIRSTDPDNGNHLITAYGYFPAFHLYVAASISPDEENRSMVRDNIRNAALIGLAIILVLSIYIYFMATSRLHRYFLKVQESRQKLSSTREALKQSEDRFHTLFNNAMDEIFLVETNGKLVEFNKVAADILGYTVEEFAGKTLQKLASPRARQTVDKHLSHVIEKGKDTCESEQMSKSGLRIPVELKSRLMYIDQKPYVLSISRNLSERKETERRILSTVIQTEEKERDRFSRDMHDGLGPMLSTIKLYINELRGELDKDEKEQFITQSSELIDEAIDSTRTISNNLMPRMIHEYGLVRALDSFCDKLNRTGRINVEIMDQMRELKPDKNMELILFRVLTELINNTLKHSTADHININLVKADENLLDVLYEDNGDGFSADEVMEKQGEGMGLKNIASRIKSINGMLNFSGGDDRGLVVRIRLPL